MYVFIVVVHHRNLVPPVVDVFQSLKDAEDRRERAMVTFPQDKGYTVSLKEVWASPDLTTLYEWAKNHNQS